MRSSLVAIAAALALSACTPCGGILTCSDDPSLTVSGRVIDPATGHGVGGVALVATVDQASAAATTDGTGDFLVQVPLSAAGETEYRLEVTPPGAATWTAARLTCRTSRTVGSGCPLGLINVLPIFPGGGFVIFRGADRAPLPPGPAVFRRTGGARLAGGDVRGDSITFLIDLTSGHVNLFNADVHAVDVEELVGDLVIAVPPPLDSVFARDIHVSPSMRFHEQIPPLLIEVGPSLRTQFSFVDTAGGPASGVRIRFVRSGGVSVDTTRLEATSDGSGNAELDPRPFERGALQGSLEVDATGAGGTTFTIPGLSLATRDSSGVVAAGKWTVRGAPVSAPSAMQRR